MIPTDHIPSLTVKFYTYVNVSSNHPPGILKNIPDSVNKRLSGLSKTEEIFNSSVGPYQEALEKEGHRVKLDFS